MKIKKLLCLLFALLMVVGLFAGCSGKTEQKKEFQTFEDFKDAKLGVLTGSEYDRLTQELFPDSEKFQFADVANLILSLDADKIDGFLLDSAYYSAVGWEREGYKSIQSDNNTTVSYAFMLSESGMAKKVKGELDEFITDMKSNGGIETLAEKWLSGRKPTEFEDYSTLSGENGILTVAVSNSDMPLSFVSEDIARGFDVEIMIAFAKEYGYKLNFAPVDFEAKLGGIASNKYDIAIGGITVTDERREEMNFTVSYYESPVVMVTKGQDNAGSTLSDLAGKKVGVMTASIQAVMMPKLVPDAEYMEFNSISDMIAALNSNKIDAFGCDESLYTSMLWEGQAVDRIDEPIDKSNYGLIFQKGKKLELQNEVNEFIATISADGTLKALEEKWFGAKEPTEFASYENLNGTKGTIKVAINSASKPFVYLKNNKFVGFDIEFIIAFAKEYGYNIKFEDTEFAAILSGVGSGRYDLGISGITITDERKESMDFSDVYHVEDLAVIIRSEAGADDLSQFNSATLGVVTGSLYGGYSKEQFPNAKIKEFNNFSDVLVALKQGKVDGIMLDRPNFNSVARTDKSLKCITVPAYSVEIGFGFQKNDGGDALQAQMNEFLAKLDSDGTTEKLIDKWYGETEPEETIALEELKANEKTLNVSIDTTRKPFVYMYKGKPVGFEIEVLYMFCKEYGYNVNISDVSFASGLAGLASEKYDLVCGGLYMTPERKESVNFSNPYMNAEVVMAKCERSGFDNFMLSIKESFEKTFVREQRWKLIVEGICTTMIISLFSVLGGTLLGFALYMAARSKKKWLSKLAKGIAKVYSTIIAGTPTLVVLMLLFYVVFTSPDMSGIVVAIVGFILTFGSFVYDNLALTVSGVDNGQLEAAYALGYSRNRTFFRIILPQAMKMFVPAYSGEIVNLIKATSVVGYIAVNDLTKMGDIIRGNTYEAFFPLIAVAVIYFAITWIIAGLLGILRKKTEPKRRKNKNILKGVVR